MYIPTSNKQKEVEGLSILYMSDFQGSLIVITIGLVIFFTFFVFARFSYEISHDYLRMRQRILIYIPFSFFRIKTKNIQEVRRFDFKKDVLSLRGFFIFGNLFRKKGVMIILRRWSFRGRRIFISPENPDRFIKEMSSIICSNFNITSKDSNKHSARPEV